MELVEDGGKDLEEVDPIPRGTEFEFIPVDGMTELRLTPDPKGTEGDELAPIGGRTMLELIPVGGMRELGLTPVPK